MSEALVLCGVDVVDAEAFTRDTPNGKEAVDMFWLRRLEGTAEHALTELDVERVRTALVALLDGSLPSGARPPSSSLPSARGWHQHPRAFPRRLERRVGNAGNRDRKIALVCCSPFRARCLHSRYK